MQRLLAGAMLLFCVNVAFGEDSERTPAAPASGLTLTPAGSVNMQPVAPGDFWSYEVKDEISGNIIQTRTIVVTDVTQDAIATRFNAPKPGQFGAIQFDRSWNIVSSNAAKYSPNDGTGVRLPLQPDARWNFTSDVAYANNGPIVKRIGNSRVTGQEIVTTKAGKFDTTIFETNYSTRNPAEPTRKSETLIRTWYSTDINHWVRRNTVVRQNGLVYENEMIELIDYGRKK